MEALQALERALERRAELLEKLNDEGTTIFRLCGGEREGVPGLVIDVFERFAVMATLEGKCSLDDSALEKVASWVSEQLTVPSVVLKRWNRDRSKEEKPEPFRVYGKAVEERSTAKENGISYWVKPNDGLQVGIFGDQREHRRLLAGASAGKDVLNCFSYTCAFSVACAAKGARVTSVDISKKALEWGKENFTLNKLALEPHRFLVEDTERAFERLQKQGRQFDLIILDPPSFSRTSEGKVFQVEQHLPALVEKAAALVRTGGSLFVSTNYAKWRASQFVGLLQHGLPESKWAPVPLPDLPADFMWDADPLKAACFKSI